MGYHTERNIHFMIFDDDWLADWQTDALPDSYRNGEVYDKWFIMLIDWFWEQRIKGGILFFQMNVPSAVFLPSSEDGHFTHLLVATPIPTLNL